MQGEAMRGDAGSRNPDITTGARPAAGQRHGEAVFDLTTIIFLALAVFIFIRLRSVLGQRTGRERPPYDPFSGDKADKPNGNSSNDDNVVQLPNRASAPPPAQPQPESAGDDEDEAKSAVWRWEGIAPEGSPNAAALDEIARAEPDFNGPYFLEGAKAAYEMIVTAYANGDRRTLKDMLAKDVYDNFVAAISDREGRGETMETRFVAIEKADVEEVAVEGRKARITVRFLSQLISVTRNKEGAVVDGSADTVGDVVDVWTFARELGARDPNWKLVATEAGQ